MKKILLLCFCILTLYAEDNITLACEQGNKDDCNDKGVIYGEKDDFDNALKLYKKACDLNSSMGCNNLAFMYMNGQAVKQDFLIAEKYLKKSIGLNNNDYAVINLGILYDRGYGKIKKDKKKALQYFMAACRGNVNVLACNETGRLQHELGDDKEALFYYYIGCKLGNETACYNFGQAAYRGQGMDANITLSIQYFDLGCNYGEAYACDTLAGIVFRAEGGTLPDIKLAKEYWVRACDLGLKSSCESAKEVESIR